jgi:hypothetical protein
MLQRLHLRRLCAHAYVASLTRALTRLLLHVHACAFAKSYPRVVRSCAQRLEGARPFPDLLPAFLALDRGRRGWLDRPKFALALRKVRRIRENTPVYRLPRCNCKVRKTRGKHPYCLPLKFALALRQVRKTAVEKHTPVFTAQVCPGAAQGEED